MGFDTSSPASWGLFSGLLLALAAQAAHWFITSPSDASTVRSVFVALQLVGCTGLAWWAYRRGRGLEEARVQGGEVGTA